MCINCVVRKTVVRNNYRVMARAVMNVILLGCSSGIAGTNANIFFHTGINYMVKSWNLQGGILNKIAGKLELLSHKSHKMGIPRELANVIFHLFL